MKSSAKINRPLRDHDAYYYRRRVVVVVVAAACIELEDVPADALTATPRLERAPLLLPNGAAENNHRLDARYCS